MIAALEKIADMPRGEGEKALPEVGAVLRMVETMKVARENREKAERDTEVVRRKCMTCGVTTVGFGPPSDSKRRYCRGIPQRPHEPGEICGGDMQVIHRSVAKDLNPKSGVGQ